MQTILIGTVYSSEEKTRKWSDCVAKHVEYHIIMAAIAEYDGYNDFTPCEKVNYLPVSITDRDLFVTVSNIDLDDDPCLMCTPAH